MLQSTPRMMNMSMRAKGKYLLKEKAKEEMAKVESLLGVHLVMNSGSQKVAHKDTVVRSIIQGDSPADVQYVARRATIPLNAHVQSSLKPRMPSGMTPQPNGRSLRGRPKSMKLPRARKAKARGLSPRASLKERAHRDRLHRDRLNPNPLEATDPNPKPSLKPALA